jgi:hypothetical protein
VQVGQDHALVDDDHAGAHAALDLAIGAGAVEGGFGRLALGHVAAALLVLASGVVFSVP